MSKTYIVDYGVGNLFSLKSSLETVGSDSLLTADPDEIIKADRLILPGVGAFPDAAEKLRSSGMWDAVKEFAKSGKPLLGICLGMQLLFDESIEYGTHEGLGLIPGRVMPLCDFAPVDYKIPHMGWNSLDIVNDSPIYKYLKGGEFVYFVHSYFARCPHEYKTAIAEYGIDVTASVARDNVMGTQYHPEKSGEVGLNILRAFCEM